MNIKTVSQKRPATSYFIAAFTISWLGAFLLVAPKLFRSLPIPKLDGILMFPLMIIGPPAAGIILTAFCEGKPGLRNLWRRMANWKAWIIVFIILTLKKKNDFELNFLLFHQGR